MSWPPLNVALSRLLCASYVLSDVLIAVPMSFANYLLYIKGQNPRNIMCCVLLKFGSANLFFFMLDSNAERLLAYSLWKIEGCKWEKKCINNKFLFLFTLWMDESKKREKNQTNWPWFLLGTSFLFSFFSFSFFSFSLSRHPNSEITTGHVQHQLNVF